MRIQGGTCTQKGCDERLSAYSPRGFASPGAGNLNWKIAKRITKSK